MAGWGRDLQLNADGDLELPGNLIVAGGITIGGDVSMGSGDQFFLDDGAAADPSVAWTNSVRMGFYRATNNVIGVALNGSSTWQFTNQRFYHDAVLGAALLRNTASAILPSIVPNRADLITGAGWGGIGQLTLISKGVNCLTVKTTKSITAVTFVGAGLDDGTSGGTYTGSTDKAIEVEIDLAAGTDTFKWSNDGGSSYEVEDIPITGSAQTLEDGITINFGATTGHTLGDKWTFSALTGAQVVLHDLTILSTDTSNHLRLSHDNTNALFRTDDGSFIFQTDEGTNTLGKIDIKGKGSGDAQLSLTRISQDARLDIRTNANGEHGINLGGSTIGNLNLVSSANGNVKLFGSAAEGITREFTISGFRTGDALRILEIGVGVDAPNTASFTGLGSYLFGGAVHMAEISTPTAIADKGAIYPKTDDNLYFQDGAGVEKQISVADYAGIVVDKNAVETTINLVNSYEKATIFDTDLPELISNGAHGTDDITIGATADYEISFGRSGQSPDGANKVFEYEVFQIAAGTATITGITNADPAVITFQAGHGFSNGNRIKILGVSTMTEVNNRIFTLADQSGDTFELTDDGGVSPGNDIDATGFAGAGTGGTAQLATKVNTHDHRKFAIQNDIGSFGQPGMAALTKDNTIELWVKGVTDASNFLFEAAHLMIKRLN